MKDSAHRPSVVIVGTGFGGIAAALELKRHGHHDFTILERASEVGGVWRENTYPGAGCDIPSPYYSYSFEPNPRWPMRFSLQPDIHAYLKRVVDKHGLRRHIRFDTEATAADFDAGTGKWRVHTAAGDTVEADVFVAATGQLSRPAWPKLPGAEGFQGHTFHSAQWDHDYDLRGKRVAVIGTGASAIQFVPRIQPQVAHLTLFQRSAPYIVPKPDTEYKPLHHTVFTHFPLLQQLERVAWWTVGELGTLGIIGNEPVARLAKWIALSHLRRQVADPVLRDKLTPDYDIGCKRVLFADNYYPALTQPNVTLDTDPITEITATGVRTTNAEHTDLDAIIYGTGFATQDFLGPLRVHGVDGRDLRDVWSDGAHAYLGMCVPGFPNLFLVYGPNTNLGSGSIIYMIERQARYIRQLVEHLADHPGSYVDVRPEVEDAYDTDTQRRLRETAWATCTSWYRNDSGRVSTNWPGLVSEYDRRTRRVNLSDFHTVRSKEHA